MSVIKKIREKYAKAAGAVIALALVGFILMDAGSGWVRNLFGSDNTLATVGGDKVTAEEYSARLFELQTLRKVFPQDESLSSSEKTANDRESALRGLIFDKQIEREAGKLGLTVTDAEMKALYMSDPTFQQFYQKIGVPQDQVPSLVSQLEKGGAAAAGNPQLQELTEIWNSLKNFIRRNQLAQKYSALVGNSYYTPKFIGDRYQQDQTNLLGIRYVKIPLSAIPDSEVPVTDADINSYMEKHKAMFMLPEPSRSIEYVSFDVMPDTKDTAGSLGELQKMRDNFAATDTASVSGFVMGSGSDEPYTGAWTTKKTFMSPVADTIMALSPGQVYGPYFDGGHYKLTKMVEKRTVPDSAKASHILIGMEQRDDSTASKLADSLVAQINAGVSFDSLARQFSDDGQGPDGGSKAKGGDLGFFGFGTMVPEFNEAVFSGSVGDLKKVRTQFGYHIIRITGQVGSQLAAKLATVSRELAPGTTAVSAVFGRANAFASSNNTAAKFEAAIKKDGLVKRTAANVNPASFSIEGLGPARELITWVYGAKVGDVSPAFETGPTGKNHYVIAKLTGIQDDGMMKLNESNRAQLESMVRQEKKAEKIAGKFKGANLDAIAAQAGQPVAMADSIRGGGSSLGAAGYEPKVIGYALNPKTALNTLSPAIKGKDGVYFISVAYRTTTAPDPMAAQQLQMQDLQGRGMFGQSLPAALQRVQPVKYKAANIR